MARLRSRRPYTRLALALCPVGILATSAVPPRHRPPTRGRQRMIARILESTLSSAIAPLPPCLRLVPTVYTEPTGSRPVAPVMHAVDSFLHRMFPCRTRTAPPLPQYGPSSRKPFKIPQVSHLNLHNLIPLRRPTTRSYRWMKLPPRLCACTRLFACVAWPPCSNVIPTDMHCVQPCV